MYFRKNPSSEDRLLCFAMIVIVMMTVPDAALDSDVVSVSMTTHDVGLRNHHHCSLVAVSQRRRCYLEHQL
jgi:hypothetical protein